MTKSLKNTAVDILVKCSFQSWLVCKINYCLLFFVYFNTTTSLKLFYYKPDYLQNVVQFTLFFQSFLKITLLRDECIANECTHAFPYMERLRNIMSDSLIFLIH